MNHSRHVALMSIFGAVILIMCGFLFGISVARLPIVEVFQPNSGVVSNQSLTYLTLVSEHNESSPIFEYSYEYPQFHNVSAQFNNSITQTVLSSLEQFKKNSTDNWQARQDTETNHQTLPPNPENRFLFDLTWQPVQVNNSYVSFILSLYSYSGGAHGQKFDVAFNYDVRRDHEMTLADLYPNNPNYLQDVASSSRSILRNTLINMNSGAEGIYEGMLIDGTKPTVENFSDFTFDKDSITLYFGEYQVAPYVFGPQTVVLPLPRSNP